MLAWTGWDFRVIPANLDERQLPGESPDRYVLRLAESKARAVLPLAANGEIVLAADTIVVDGEELLGKPAGPVEAMRMLRQLRGRNHQVYTALAVANPATAEILQDLCVSQVPMRAYEDTEIETYVYSGDPLDKAGGYAIQNQAFHPVIDFRGCFASVMGLPLCHLTRTLGKMGLTAGVDIPCSLPNKPQLYLPGLCSRFERRKRRLKNQAFMENKRS